MRILKSLIHSFICEWIEICKKRIRLLAVEQRNIETIRNFYPKRSFGYDRLTLGMALSDVHISILVALRIKLRRLLQTLKVEKKI